MFEWLRRRSRFRITCERCGESVEPRISKPSTRDRETSDDLASELTCCLPIRWYGCPACGAIMEL